MSNTVETTIGKNIILPYTSHFNEFTSEVALIEDFEGNARVAVNKLRESLQTGNEPIHKNIFLFSLITKGTIDLKVKLWEGRNGGDNADKIEAAVRAIDLCVDLSDPIYHDQSKKALEILEEYETFVSENGLEGIFSTNVTERKADRMIMPPGAGEEDLAKAKNLAKTIGNAKILAIILANRGIRRGFDFFYDYVSQTGISGSKARIVQCKNTFPKITDSEAKSLIDDAKGRQVVVIGPPELYDIYRSGEKKVINRLRLAKNCFSKEVFGTPRNPAKVIAIPISFSKK